MSGVWDYPTTYVHCFATGFSCWLISIPTCFPLAISVLAEVALHLSRCPLLVIVTVIIVVLDQMQWLTILLL